MDICHSNGLNQVDLLTPAERKISEKEYWAKRRCQKKLDEHNAELKKKGLTPRQTTFQTEKQYLRDAIDTVASQATSQEEFSRYCLKNIILHLKSVVADTAICILIVKNTSPEEISELFMKKIIFCWYSRRTPTGNMQKSHILLTAQDQLQIFQNNQNRQLLSKLTKPHTLSFL